jgi:hypothetical protein
VSKDVKPTRRIFLGASAATPVLISAIQPADQALAQVVQDTLKTVMDLVIPASEGMPSASEAGGLRYLRGLMLRDKDTGTDITKGLAVVDAFSARSFRKPFHQLERNDQIAVLKDMENGAPGVFDVLRAYIYESYYTQPAIWELIGYKLYPTDHTGPHMKPFDDSLLEKVRNMPKLYRDA